ncbi:MAG: hypothetical protein ACMUHY_09735, partial [Thermoplasmatota archaeon]
TGVTFSVHYNHTNGTAPRWVRVNVTTGSAQGTYYMSTSDTNYSGGVRYTVNVSLPAGYHYYVYECYVTDVEQVSLPVSGVYTIFVASTTTNNNAPVLSNWGYYPNYYPEPGVNITFWVHYSDQDMDRPLYVNLYYYPEDDRMDITTLNMSVGSGNLTVGVNCTRVVRMSENGTYYYFMQAKDGRGGTDTTDHFPFEVGNRPKPPRNPFIHHGKTTPDVPTTQDTINFTVKYTDDSGKYLPAYVKLHIANETGNFVNYTMTADSTNASMVITYHHNLKLANDTYRYFFESMIDRNYSRDPTTGYRWVIVRAQSLPPRDSPPQLSSGSHYPPNPKGGQNVTFTVTYADRDGDAPLYVNLLIGQPWLNTPTMKVHNMTVTGTGYSTGVTASVTIGLSANNYGYYFQTYSNSSSGRLPSSYWTNLTVGVPPDTPPTLARGSYTPANPTDSSNITFSAVYSDKDGDPPIWIKLYINPVQSSQPYTKYNMTVSGSTYTAGVTASVTIKLSAGNYSYYFEAAQRNLTVSLPATGVSIISVARSSAPQQNLAPTLTNPTVSPASPTANQTVYFTITYTDADGDAPSYVKVHILFGGGKGYQNFSMSVPKYGFTRGVSCTYSTSFFTGTYYYYFTTASTNHSVTYPSNGVLTLVVSSSSPPNRTTIGAIASFGPDTGSGDDFEVETFDEGFTVTLIDSGKGKVEVRVVSESGEDRILAMDLDLSLFDIEDPRDLIVMVDGIRIPYRFVEDPGTMSGDEPFYSVVTRGDGSTLYVYLPLADTHEITARIEKDSPDDNTIWYVFAAAFVAIAIGVIVGIFLLTSAQRRKIDAYYEDFDVGFRPDGVITGRLANEEEIEWDDLIEG